MSEQADRIEQEINANSISQKSDATVQHPPTTPPKLAYEPHILSLFKEAIRGLGVVGEEQTAATLYLLITSRLLDKPVSAAVKGHTSSGKSYTTVQVVKFFPQDAVVEMTAMSERALVYSEDDYQHRTLVLYEATALREGAEDNLTAYFVRSLLSEGRIEYPVTVRDGGNFVTKTIVKEGPTNLVVTTTKTRVHAENETRLLSLVTDDSREQTARVLKALASEAESTVDLDTWRELQAWLQEHGERKVTIPYADRLSELVPPVAVRLRRDFGAVLALIRAHAILHQRTRERDAHDRIVATLDDYVVVRELVAGVIGEGVGASVSDVIRSTVEAVRKLAGDAGVKAAEVGKLLDLDKSTVSRRLRQAADGGYIRNLEEKRGKPGRWISDEPLPGEKPILPDPCNLATPDTPATRITASGCRVAGGFGG